MNKKKFKSSYSRYAKSLYSPSVQVFFLIVVIMLSFASGYCTRRGLVGGTVVGWGILYVLLFIMTAWKTIKKIYYLKNGYATSKITKKIQKASIVLLFIDILLVIWIFCKLYIIKNTNNVSLFKEKYEDYIFVLIMLYVTLELNKYIKGCAEECRFITDRYIVNLTNITHIEKIGEANILGAELIWIKMYDKKGVVAIDNVFEEDYLNLKRVIETNL
ncbi:MAG: hypothetical protein VZR24_07880 [Butyrivibrio hungatei]|nr:hypothetical protein [Butyrivibrio hungatei]